MYLDELKEMLKLLKFESEKIEEFANFYIFKLEELESKQVGYSIDTNGNSLICDKEGSWKREWIVVGYETLCGDPIIIDTNEVKLPVSLLMHGMGEWTGGTFISELTDLFVKELKSVSSFISERSNQNINPRITCAELDELLKNSINKDIYGDIDQWKSMLDPIYVSTKEYEESLAKKVKKLSVQGMKINEISDVLNMYIENIYIFKKE